MRRCQQGSLPQLALPRIQQCKLDICSRAQLALEWVWSTHMSQLRRERFLSRNVTIDFLDDVFAGTGPGWLNAPLLFSFDGELRALSQVTSSCFV